MTDGYRLLLFFLTLTAIGASAAWIFMVALLWHLGLNRKDDQDAT